MIAILLGIVSSIFSEVITWVNKKLSNTLLRGDGAFIVSFIVAYIIAFVKVATAPGFSFSSITSVAHVWTLFGGVFAASQVWFQFIIAKFGIDVKPGIDTKEIPPDTQTEEDSK